jgi:hypothetical protein
MGSAEFGYRKAGKKEARKEKNRTLKDEAVSLKPFFRIEAFADELFKLDFFL